MEQFELIRDLPYATHAELARYLDPPGQRSWRSVAAKLPKHYDSRDVELFAMQAQIPGGSPTREMLKDMGHRSITVKQLAFILRRLEHEPALLLLVPKGTDICSLFSARKTECTR